MSNGETEPYTAKEFVQRFQELFQRRPPDVESVGVVFTPEGMLIVGPTGNPAQFLGMVEVLRVQYVQLHMPPQRKQIIDKPINGLPDGVVLM